MNAPTLELAHSSKYFPMGLVSITCSKPAPGPHPAGRRCSHPDCITILNRWHEGDRCYQHAPPKRATDREARESMEDLMTEAA